MCVYVGVLVCCRCVCMYMHGSVCVSTFHSREGAHVPMYHESSVSV